MKTYFVNIYCNGKLTIIAVEATCLIEAQRKAIPAFRSFMKLRSALLKADKQQISFSN